MVVEPDAANEKAIARMVQAGFELGPEVVLLEIFIREKEARLAFYAHD